jgi:hypothetical protein
MVPRSGGITAPASDLAAATRPANCDALRTDATPSVAFTRGNAGKPYPRGNHVMPSTTALHVSLNPRNGDPPEVPVVLCTSPQRAHGMRVIDPGSASRNPCRKPEADGDLIASAYWKGGLPKPSHSTEGRSGPRSTPRRLSEMQLRPPGLCWRVNARRPREERGSSCHLANPERGAVIIRTSYRHAGPSDQSPANVPSRETFNICGKRHYFAIAPRLGIASLTDQWGIDGGNDAVFCSSDPKRATNDGHCIASTHSGLHGVHERRITLLFLVH